MFAMWCFVSTLLVATQASAPVDPLIMYTHHSSKCVHGNNIRQYFGKTPAECAELCDIYGDKCMGFEFGVSRGGTKGKYKPGDCTLQSSADTAGCDGNAYNLDFYEKYAGGPLTNALMDLSLWASSAELDTPVSCSDYTWMENCNSDPAAPPQIPTNEDLLNFTSMVTDKYYALFGRDPNQAPPAPTAEPTTSSPTTPAPTTPAAVDGVALFVAAFANCAIKQSDSHLDCWGWHHHQVTTVVPDVAYKQACMGEWFGCGLRADTSTVECWGGDWHGETIPPPTVFTRIRCGGHHACGFKEDGHLECWGANYALQSDVIPDVAYFSMSANRNHACGVRADDFHLECWGRNTNGELDVNPDIPYAHVACGYQNTCAIRADTGHVECWGANNHDQSVPSPDVPYVGLSGAEQFVCGLRADNRHVECWGGNHLTRYGITAGIPDQAYREMQVGFSGHVCARQETGIVDCWGGNTYGQGTGRGDTVYGI